MVGKRSAIKRGRNNSRSKGGRPRKADPPRLPYEEIDRLLVHGEVTPTRDGRDTTVVYPSYRELGDRYGVSNSAIALYSKSHNCIRRRKTAQARVTVEVDKKLVEMRSNAIAVTHDDQIRMIDSYLLKFEKAIADGRMRFDNPSDFNTLCRLKEFLLGGADSRQEIHAALSLEDLQSRHRQMMKDIESSSSAERGLYHEHPRRLAPSNPGKAEAIPPTVSLKSEHEKLSGQFSQSAKSGRTGAKKSVMVQESPEGKSRQTRANVEQTERDCSEAEEDDAEDAEP